METGRRERLVHLFFDISVVAKGIDGVLEIVGGALLFFVSPGQLYNLARILTQHELSDDPHDIVANYIVHSSQRLSESAKLFGAIYLLWHGVVKVGLVTALLRKQRWAYPLAIGAFTVFLVYQLYRYALAPSPELLVLSLLDAAVIVLAWLEYRRLRTADVLR